MPEIAAGALRESTASSSSSPQDEASATVGAAPGAEGTNKMSTCANEFSVRLTSSHNLHCQIISFVQPSSVTY